MPCVPAADRVHLFMPVLGIDEMPDVAWSPDAAPMGWGVPPTKAQIAWANGWCAANIPGYVPPPEETTP